ncbi:MAG TPA: oligosaccharide repeat unit polymerase [Anaerolineae bacterium]|nr:oligosaccharide repeat unit polymerase [Anaerolineae bacterium]
MITSRHRHPVLSQQIVLIALAALLAMGTGMYIALAPFAEYQLAVAVVWLINVGLMLLPLYLDKAILNRSWDWFSPLLYELFTSYLGVFRPLFIAFGGWETAWIHDSPENLASLLIETLLISMVGRTALLVGYYSSLGLQLSQRLRAIPGKWSPRRLRLIAVVVIGAGVLGYLKVMSSVGGLTRFLDNLFFRRQLLAGKSYILWPTYLIPLVAWMMWAHHLRSKRRISFSLVLFFAIVVLLMATLGGRGAIAQVGIVALGIFHYLRRRVKLWHLVVLGIVAALFFDAYQDVRTSTLTGELDLTSAITRETDQSFIDTVLNQSEGIDRTMVVIDGIPERIPFQYFTTYTRIITTIVPRRIWPTKPALGESSVYQPLFLPGHDGRSSSSYPAGTVGDFYLQLGVPGVIIGFFMGGVCRRLLYEYLLRHKSNSGVVVLYMVALSIPVFRLRNQHIVLFLTKAVPLVVLALFLRSKRSQPMAHSVTPFSMSEGTSQLRS